jgi:lipopolysaccharide/colanic/teichoic acid biosynthesis glycosyltransferase
LGTTTIDNQQLLAPEVHAPHPSLTTASGVVKRFVDHTAVLVGAFVAAPVIAAVAVLIKLDSPGPVLFKQRRVGLHGQEFWMYKFRTMHVDAEAQLAELQPHNEMDGPLFKMTDDPRTTRFGKWLRKSSLDELPQLLNVVRGEMTLIGPRPPLPSEVAEFAPHHHEKFNVLPGLTGLWQVSGRSNIGSFEEICALDLAYVREWSLGLDFKILLKTVPVVIGCIGAR